MTRKLIPDPDLTSRFQSDLEGLVGSDAMIGIAVSGGPDSLALLLLAAAARPGRIKAATVDHRLRPDSQGEAEMVAAVCQRLGVEHATLDLEGLSGSDGNLQARARAGRYEALGAWASGRGLGAVATAHHLDDQAETLLMRIARGAGVGGMAAIQPARPLSGPVLLIRPLLHWRQHELRAIVEAAGLAPVNDPSNQDERFDRTRARNLLATTEWLDPERLAAVASNAADAAQALDWAAHRAFEDRALDEGSALSLDPEGLPQELLRRLLLLAIEALSAVTPPGPDLMRAIEALEAGEVTTLAGLKLEGGARWRLSVAPARRPTPFTES